MAEREPYELERDDADLANPELSEDTIKPSDEVLYRPDSFDAHRLTVDEAAEELNMDHGMVEDMVREGSLPTTPGGGDAIIDMQDLRKFQHDNTQGVLPQGSNEVVEPRRLPPDSGDVSQAVT